MRIKKVLNDASGAVEPKPRRISQALKAYLDRDVTASKTPVVDKITIGDVELTEYKLKHPNVDKINVNNAVVVGNESFDKAWFDDPTVNSIKIGGNRTAIEAIDAENIKKLRTEYQPELSSSPAAEEPAAEEAPAEDAAG